MANVRGRDESEFLTLTAEMGIKAEVEANYLQETNQDLVELKTQPLHPFAGQRF